ncbi:MAG: hypothetical protein GY765_29440 [bacterium]|nr:hypothetical protein [bacterium]
MSEMLRFIIKVVTFLFALVKRKDYVIFPAVREQAVLSDILFKTSFMLPNKRVFYRGLPKSEARKPDYLDDISLSPTIAAVGILKQLWCLLTFRNILVWKTSSNPICKLLFHLPHVFNIDAASSAHEGWEYFYAFNYTLRKSERVYPVLTDFSKKEKCYVFGSGKSLDSAVDYDFSHGHRIVCNSMVRNIPLMKHIAPHFMMFGDAVYHFGPSVYAGAFRRALLHFVEHFPQCKLIVPEVFYHHFFASYPQLQGHVAAIPFCGCKAVNLNLKDRYCTHDYGNVLNLLLIPMASTISDHVYFLGFDGRATGDDKFWSYSSENNFCDLLESQEEAHPGFFLERDYSEYSGTFGDHTEHIFQHGESIGKKYSSLAPSNNEAMKKRYRGNKDV